MWGRFHGLMSRCWVLMRRPCMTTCHLKDFDVGGKFCGFKFSTSQRQLCIMHN